MNLDLLREQLTESALVEKKKKASTFTIRPIGGPEEIILWRRQQAAKEATYRLRLNARDERVAAFEAETGQKLDSPTLGKESWSDRLAFAKSERARLARLEEIASSPYIPEPEHVPSLFRRIASYFKRLWKAANF